MKLTEKLLLTSLLIIFSACVIKAEKITIEAENAALAQKDQIIKANWASGGKAVKLKNARKLTRQEMNKSQKPYLTFKYNLTIKGSYKIRFYVYAKDGSSDSFYFSVNGGRLYQFNVEKVGQIYTLSRDFNFSSGSHSIEVYTRENNLLMDKLTIDKNEAKYSGKLTVPNWGAPPCYPPKSHPRVLLNPEYIAKLKLLIKNNQKFKEAYKNLKKIVNHKNSGMLLANNSARTGALKEIRAQAFIYALESNSDDGKLAIVKIKKFLAKAKYPKNNDISRFYGETIYTAGLVYDWCYPLLTSVDKKEFYNGIMKLAKMLEIGWPPVRQGNITSHAGEAQLFRDLLSAAIAIYNEHPEVYDLCSRRFFAEMVPARKFFFKSHRHHQGDSYGPYRFSWAAWSAIIFKRMNGTMVFPKDMGKVPYSWIYDRLPNGQVMRDGDTFRSGSFWVVPMRHIIIASLYKNPYVKWESESQAVDEFINSNPLQYMLFTDPNVKARNFTKLPLTKFFPEPLASMTIRTGWNNGLDSNTAIIRLNGAGYYFGNHQHLDAGAFQIYYRGALAIDSGAYKGLKYGTPYDWSYNKRTISHNAMLAYDPDEKVVRAINDGGQRFPNNRKEPRSLEILKNNYRNGYTQEYAFGPDKSNPFYNYMKVDLTKAYSNKITSYQRSFCFFNFDDPQRPGALVVFDRMTTAKPITRKYWLLHSIQKPEITGDRIVIKRNKDGYSGKLIDTVILPEQSNLKAEIVGGKKQINHVFGLNFSINKNNDQSSKWRIQLSPKAAAKNDLFLNVLQPMDVNLKQELPVRMIKTNNLIGVEVNNRIVTFSKKDAKLKSNINLKTSKPGTQILLTGLELGMWTMNSSNKNICKVLVKKSNNTAFFVAGKAGIYSFSRNDDIKAPVQDLSQLKPKIQKPSGPRVILNGKKINIDKMIYKKFRTYIPAKQLLEQSGAKVNQSNGILTAKLNDRTLVIKNGDKKYSINNISFRLRESIFTHGGKLYFPVEAIAGFLKKKYMIDGRAKFINLTNMPAGRKKYPWYEDIFSYYLNPSHPPEDSCDGFADTYWAGRGKQASITYDLGITATVKGMKIIWYKGNQRKAFFKIMTSFDEKKWNKAFDGSSSGKNKNFELFSFPPVKARYIKIIGNGASGSNFTSICEAAVVTQD